MLKVSLSTFRAYIFFSSPIPKDLVTYIKNDMSVIPRIGALREVTFCIPSTLMFFGGKFSDAMVLSIADEFGVFCYRHAGTHNLRSI
jgi:hypothetical protein